jgi:excisionase family DNA binding protein
MAPDADADALNLHRRLSELLKEVDALDSAQLSPVLAQVTALQTTLLAKLLVQQGQERRADTASEDHLLTVEEAAERLGTSRDWLYRKAHKLPFTVRLGSRRLRFSSKGIDRYLRTRQGLR